MRKKSFKNLHRQGKYQENRTSLAQGVVSALLAAGLTLAPWLHREVAAGGNITLTADKNTNLMVNGKADIYAEKASGTVGLNSFTSFNVGKDELANLYFKQQNSSQTLNSLINTVENRIDIQGTVNAIRNNKVGGDLYFLSPGGMVVGAGGAINAGSLTVIASGNTYSDPQKALEAINKKSYSQENSASIDVYGQINTATGIDLRAATINVQKESAASAAPLLQTGVIFDTVVNNDLVTSANVKDGKLTASVDKDGKIIFADASNTATSGDGYLTGDGSINMTAEVSANTTNLGNAKTKFLGTEALWNTAKATINIGEGAEVKAAGNVGMNANASIVQNNDVTNLVDIAVYADASVNVAGKVSGADVQLSATAMAEHDAGNIQNIFALANSATNTIDYEFSDDLTNAVWARMCESATFAENGGSTGIKSVTALNNILNQLYMPFVLSNAQADVNVAQNASIDANIVKGADGEALSYAVDGKTKLVGGNLDVSATSTAINTMSVSLQPKMQVNMSDPVSSFFTGGFIYSDSTSKALVNVDGLLQAEQDLAINAQATNTNKSSMVIAPIKYYTNKVEEEEPNVKSAAFNVALGLTYANTEAVVNLGSAALSDKGSAASPRIQAGGDLSVHATSTNTVSESTTVTARDSTALATSINIASAKGKAEINDYVALEGKSVDLNALQTLKSLSITTQNNFTGELTGVQWLLNSQTCRDGADKAREGLQTLAKRLAGGNTNKAIANTAATNATSAASASSASPKWSEYFDIGAGVTVANVENTANINIQPDASITATAGALNVNAKVNIADTSIKTKDILVVTDKNVNLGVSAAVSVVNLDNNANVNVGKNAQLISNQGALNVNAAVDEQYNRVDTMVQNLQKGWEDFISHWTEWDADGRKEKLTSLENIIASLLTITGPYAKESFKTDTAYNSKYIDYANSALKLVENLTGTTTLIPALEAFTDASNYVNVYVDATTKDAVNADVPLMLTGMVGVENLQNNANVYLDAQSVLKAGTDVAVNAKIDETNIIGAGHWAWLPTAVTGGIISSKGAQTGIGGTVLLQEADNKSNVTVMNGTQVEAQNITLESANEVLNLGLIIGGAQTSSLGITGMVNMMSGTSEAKTLVDDDAYLSARINDNAGKINIKSDNDTVLISIVGDMTGSGSSAVGASVGIIDYDITSLAKVVNLEDADTEGRGLITAKELSVEAVTDGVINNLTIAGTSSGKSNSNKDNGGSTSTVRTNTGEQSELADMIITPEGSTEELEENLTRAASGSSSASTAVRLNASGSVSWNTVFDTTEAGLDGINVNLWGDSAKLHVNAEDKSYIGAYSGAMALTKFGNSNLSSFTGSLSGAVGVNSLKKTTQALVKNSTIGGTATGIDFLNNAQNTGSQVAAGLSLGLETGERAGGVAINLGASVSANYIDSTVQAELENISLSGNAMTVNNLAYDSDVQVAGGVTGQFAGSTAALGAAVSYNTVTNDIQASMKNVNLGNEANYADVVHNIAAAKLTQVGAAVSAGLDTAKQGSYALGEVALAFNNVNNNVQSTIDGGAIYAQEFTAQAVDGQLTHTDNSYTSSLNTVQKSVITKEENGLYTFYLLDKDGNEQKLIDKYFTNDNTEVSLADIDYLHCKFADGKLVTYMVDANNNEIVLTHKYFVAKNGVETEVTLDGTYSKNIYDLDGADAMTNINGDGGFKVGVTSSGNTNTYTTSEISVDNTGSTIVGAALGLAVKVGGEGVGAAVATNMNNIENNFTATVQNAQLHTKGTAANAANSVNVSAQSDSKIIGVAAGVAAASGTKASIAAAGSAVQSKLNNKTIAEVVNSEVQTGALNINAANKSDIVSVAGEISVALGKYGAAAGLTWAENVLNNTTAAYAKGITLSGLDTADLLLQATNEGKTWSAAAGVGVSSTTGAAQGAYATNSGKDDTEAIVDAYTSGETEKQNVITSTGNITVQAEDKTQKNALAGTVGVEFGSGAAGITLGGSVAQNIIGNSSQDKQNVTAALNKTSIAKGNAGTISVTADNESKLLTLALGGAVQGGQKVEVGVQADVALADIYSTTSAEMSGTTIAAPAADVNVYANSKSELTSSADSVNVDVSEINITPAAVVSVLRSEADTEAKVQDSTWSVRNATVRADSENTVLDIAAGVAVGAGTSVAVNLTANVATNTISNNTKAVVENSKLDAEGSIAVLAKSKEELQNYGGLLSVDVSTGSAAVGAGGTVVTNTIDGDTQALVNKSEINAKGSSSATLDEYALNATTNAAGDTTTSDENASNTSTDENGDTTTSDENALNTTTDENEDTTTSDENAPNTTTNDAGDITTSVTKTETTKSGLAVQAAAEHVLKDISVTGGVNVSGTAVGTDATVVLNSLGGSTSAEVNKTSLNADLGKDVAATADAFVQAYDKTDIKSHIGTLDVSVGFSTVGLGAAAAADTNTLERTTLAQIDGNGKDKGDFNAHDIKVNALSDTEVQLSESGAAVGVSSTVGLGTNATVSVDKFANKTAAVVQNIGGYAQNLNVAADRANSLHMYDNALSVGASATVATAVGVGVTYVKDVSETQALLHNSNVEALDNSTTSAVNVNAADYSRLVEEAVQANIAGSEFSFGAGVLVNTSNVNNTVNAEISSSAVGTAARRYSDVNVEALGSLSEKFTNVAVAGGTMLGVAVGVVTNTVNTGTAANVKDSTLYAQNTKVQAQENKYVNQNTAGAAVGALAVPVNTVINNFGTTLADAYAYDDGSGKTREYSTQRTQDYIDTSLSYLNQSMENISAKDYMNGAKISSPQIESVKSDTVQAKDGTQILISNSTIDAQEKLELAAKENIKLAATTYQGAVSPIGGVGVSVALSSVENNLGVTLQDANLQSKEINIVSEEGGTVSNDAWQLAVASLAVNVGYASVEHSGKNVITLQDSTLNGGSEAEQDEFVSDGSISLQALNKLNLKTNTHASGIAAANAGVSLSDIVDTAAVQIAVNSGNTIQAQSVTALAQNAPTLEGKILSPDLSITVSGGAAIATVTALGTADLSVADGNAMQAEEVKLIAQTGGGTSGASVTTHTKVEAISTSGVSVHVNKAENTNKMAASLNLGKATFAENTALTLGAVDSTQNICNIYGVTVGLVAASGSNYAITDIGTAASLQINAGDISIRSLDAYASGADSVKSNAEGNSGGIINVAPEAAVVKNTINSRTELQATGKITTSKEATLQALRTDTDNLQADAISAAVYGGSAVRVDNKITANTAVNLQNFTLNSAGDVRVEAENKLVLNYDDAYQHMLKGSIYGVDQGNYSGLHNNVTSNATVNLVKSDLLSKGDLQLAAHTDEQMRVTSYSYGYGLVGGATNSADNTITNNDQVKIAKDSKVTVAAIGKDLTVSAADDLKLMTYAYAETIGALGGTSASLKDIIERNNTIDVQGALYGWQDVNLYAGKLMDGSLSQLDLDAEAIAYSGTVIPVSFTPTLNNKVSQKNVINIGTDAQSTSIRHTNLYADTAREIVHTASGAYNSYTHSKDENTQIVTSSTGETISGFTNNNNVTIDGAVTAGVSNKIDLTIGNADEIVILDDSLRDIVQKQDGYTYVASPTVTMDVPAGSELTASSLSYGSEDYSNTLMQRYDELNVLMSEYAKDGTDSATYLGFKAESERIEQTMIDMGLAVKDDASGNLQLTQSMDVYYVELPELVASGGNININSSSLTGKGSVEAKGSPTINITNNTNLLMKVNSVVVDDPGGKLLFNNTSLVSNANDAATKTSDLSKQINEANQNGAKAEFAKLASEDGQAGSITITGNNQLNSLTYNGSLTVDGQTQNINQAVPVLANVQVQGNIINYNGDITIQSEQDDIIIQGKNVNDDVSIIGKNVRLIADNGSIVQGYVDDIVNIGGDVRQQYEELYDAFSKNHVSQNNLVEKTDPTTSKTVNTKTETETVTANVSPSGGRIAGGSVYISAADINVNGIIQSGYGDYTLTLDSAASQKIEDIQHAYNGTKELTDADVMQSSAYCISDGGAVWDSNQQCYIYNLKAYYNPYTQKILVENVDASGGRIYLTGRISNTAADGAGQIICLDGMSDFNITNNTNYTLQLGDLSTSAVNGLVQITDTAGGKTKVTTITNGEYTVTTSANNQSATTENASFAVYGDYKYYPEEGLSYTWTSGTSNVDYTRYVRKETSSWWGLASAKASKEDLKTWTEEQDYESSTAVNGTTLDRASGAVITEGNSAQNQNTFQYTVTQTQEPTDTKEKEEHYSSGFLGFYKHWDVTWTRSQGFSKSYTANIKADNPINVKFIGHAADDAVINVTSQADVELNGNVGNTTVYTDADSVALKGTVNIASTAGSVIRTSGSIYAKSVNLSAAKDISDINLAAGDTLNLSAVNTMSSATQTGSNEIVLNVNAVTGAQGNVVLGNVGSVYNDSIVNDGTTSVADITATGDIAQQANAQLAADRINLISLKGAIYGKDVNSALQLYAGQQPLGLDTLTASVNASAVGNINLAQTAGDMRIGRIYSSGGDVTLTVTNGSVEDALPYASSERADADELISRWKTIGLIDGGDTALIEAKNKYNQKVAENNKTESTEQDKTESTEQDKTESTEQDKTEYAEQDEIEYTAYQTWDQNALLYAIQDSIVNPSADSLPTTSAKDPNVIGYNVTLNVGTSVGLNTGKTTEIALSGLLDKNEDGSYKDADALNKLQQLAKADASTVSWKEDANGGKIAVITETLPVGIQQTERDGSVGAITIKNINDAATGDIFLEGRDQKVSDTTSGLTDNKDLGIGSLNSSSHITLSSLGDIINLGTSTSPSITAQSLYITAVGTIGAADNKLLTNLSSSDTSQGLSAVAKNGIYIDNYAGADNPLRVINVSSGGDIYLGNDGSIIMGVVSGSDVENYIRAEKGGSITLEARSGDIGEDDDKYKTKGIRFLNAAENADDAAKVTLKAQNGNVYVYGVASADGLNAAEQGPAGQLYVEIEHGEDKNVGITVDGKLILADSLSDDNAIDTLKIYTTTDLQLTKDLQAQTMNLGTSGKLLVESALTAENMDLAAVEQIDASAGVVSASQITLLGKEIDLSNAKNRLERVLVDTASTNAITLASTNNDNSNALSVGTTADEIIRADLSVHNYASANNTPANAVVIDGTLRLSGDVNLQNDEVNILLQNGVLEAQSVTLAAAQEIGESAGFVLKTPDLSMSSGSNASLDSASNVLEKVTVAKAGGDVTIGNGNSENSTALSIGTTQKLSGALTVTNYCAGEQNDIVLRNTQVAGKLTLDNREKDVVISGVDLVAGAFVVNAANNIQLINRASLNDDSGEFVLGEDDSLVADKEVLVQNLTAFVQNGGSISGSDVLVSENDAVQQNGGTINANAVSISNNASVLQRSGTISGNNITLQDNDSVQQNGGTINANAVSISNNASVLQRSGTISGTDITVQDNDAFTQNGGTIAGKKVNIANNKSVVQSVGLITGTDITVQDNKAFTQNDGTIQGTNITVQDNNGFTQNGGTIDGTTIELSDSVNITQNGGIIKGIDISIEDKNDFTQNGGLISGGDVSMLAQKILFHGGSVKTDTLTMIANAYIDQKYDNSSADNAPAHILKVNDTLAAVALGAGDDAVGIDIGSRFNQLQYVKVATLDGNVLVGNSNPNDVDLIVSVYDNNAFVDNVKGNIDIHNYDNGDAQQNNIWIATALTATGDVKVQNDEGSVLVGVQKNNVADEPEYSVDSDTVLSGKNVELVASNTVLNFADITAANAVKLQATQEIINKSVIKSGDTVELKTTEQDIINLGSITAEANVTMNAGEDIFNQATVQVTKGNISLVAGEDLLNLGLMEAQSGNINIVSKNGVIYNQDGADLLTGNGNVTLLANSDEGYYYHFTQVAEGGEYLASSYDMQKVDSALVQYDTNGEAYIMIDGNKVLVTKNGSVFNQGDIMALNGTITLQAKDGDVRNYDDFNTLTNAQNEVSSQYLLGANGIDIATGNIVISAVNGYLYNSKDLESGANITLTAAEGLTNFAYNVYAGKDITLTATQGDVLNTAVLESVQGDVILRAEKGNVINGASPENNAGDIITLGGKVLLEAQGKDENGAGYSVTNFGNIIAVGNAVENAAGSGSIELRSEYGDVLNYDDFNTYLKSIAGVEEETYIKTLQKAQHRSADLNDDISYNIATSNITLSAVNGEIQNYKDYLVALGDVTLEAKEGVGSFGQMIMAGGNITLSDTDGDLINRAELLSVEGDVTLNAANGSVINMLDGNVLAMNGNVTLNAGGTASEQVKYFGFGKDDNVLQGTVDNAPEGCIIVSKKYYLDGEQRVEIVNEITAPSGSTIETDIGYVNEDTNEFQKLQTVAGDVECYRDGDVVNRGDLVALVDDEQNADGKGAITLISAHGNTSNYDNFLYVDGAATVKYMGASGYKDHTVHFNPDTQYYYDKGLILSDADLFMSAREGYLYNTMNMNSKKDLTLISGKNMTVGTNFASVEAGGNVYLESTQGKLLVRDNSSVTSLNGNIILNGAQGVDVRETGMISALNGSVSAASSSGDVNIASLNAGATAIIGSDKGTVKLGTIQGKDVVLYAQNDGAELTADKVVTDNSLVLQADNINVGFVDRSANTGWLLVDITGAGDGAVQGDLTLTLDGDVHFTTTKVHNAEITIGGKAAMDKLQVLGETHVNTPGMVTAVYGSTPHRESSNYIYFDSFKNNPSGLGLGLGSSAFDLDAASESLSHMQNQLQQAAGRTGDAGNMYIYVNGAREQRSNGMLLHIDGGYSSANQRWSAEDLSEKLVDYKSLATFDEHYADPVALYSKYNVLELPEEVAVNVNVVALEGNAVNNVIVLPEPLQNGDLGATSAQDENFALAVAMQNASEESFATMQNASESEETQEYDDAVNA